ncbi:hypothetical protein SAMN02982927_01171 [Sporolactobacillus nakayamae]|uniref:Uncharacterized protein n=1 Tax=Sporolactobacillus nakayamae TaxID=269670 RepID=A0A1I2QDP1_9BACL|nr:hypothetical protein SAMN02982927_01171 [Sporolactobacillus nakayamae]
MTVQLDYLLAHTWKEKPRGLNVNELDNRYCWVAQRWQINIV